jgi:prolyl 4-hydroxylase
MNCAPVCQTCDQLHVETRCPRDPDAVDTFSKPGDVNNFFERIIAVKQYHQYQPLVLSRPPEGPWLVQFENVLSQEEADRLITLGGELGYERSADVGTEKEDGTYTKIVNSGRTSTNAWCLGKCMEDESALAIIKRIEDITLIPETNSENLQLLRYEPDQYYQEHSDYIPYQKDRQCGVRILTWYMYVDTSLQMFTKSGSDMLTILLRPPPCHRYLNDVEEGGGTRFPFLSKSSFRSVKERPKG